MKKEEENDLAFCGKRLMQINFLDPKVIAAFEKKPENKEEAAN